jgi:hypothetical protein
MAMDKQPSGEEEEEEEEEEEDMPRSMSGTDVH